MSRIKIALIELKDHPVFLDALLNIFDVENYDITIYVSYYFKKKLANENIYGREKLNFKFQHKNEKLLGFMKRNKNEIDNNNVIIFSTPELQILNKINFNSTLILNIHNLKTWLNNSSTDLVDLYQNISPEVISIDLPIKIYSSKIVCSLLKISKIVKYFIVEYYKGLIRKKIFKKTDAINLLHPNMNKLVKDKFDKKIINLPFRFPEIKKNQLDRINNEYLCVGIMGSVEQQRRDYIGFLNFLKKNTDRINYKIKFIFLGSFKGAKKYRSIILNLINDIRNSNISFELFLNNEFINQDLFDKKMKEIDIILSPIHRYKYNKIYKEEYSVTKATGSDFDAFYYNKPIIMPSFYIPISYLKKLYNFYNNYNELLDLFEFYSNKSNLLNKYQQIEIDKTSLKENYEIDIKKLIK